MSKKNFEDGKPIAITLGPDVRFLWPYVFEKRVNEEGEDKYEVLLQIPYSNKKAIALFNDAIDAAIERGYSGQLSEKSTYKKGTKESALKLPLKDGEDKADDDYGDLFNGYMYATAKSQRRPTVLDSNGQQILDPDEFYSGVIGAVSITVYPFNNRSQGVGVQLNHIMKLDDGERIGGGTISPEDAFSEYMGDNGNSRTESRTASRSRSRDDDEGERRSSRGNGRTESRSRSRGSDDPMYD